RKIRRELQNEKCKLRIANWLDASLLNTTNLASSALGCFRAEPSVTGLLQEALLQDADCKLAGVNTVYYSPVSRYAARTCDHSSLGKSLNELARPTQSCPCTT